VAGRAGHAVECRPSAAWAAKGPANYASVHIGPNVPTTIPVTVDLTLGRGVERVLVDANALPTLVPLGTAARSQPNATTHRSPIDRLASYHFLVARVRLTLGFVFLLSEIMPR